MSTTNEQARDDHYEWHERVGRELMFATRCTHDGDLFGDKAVCMTCFENTQSIGALVERYAAEAFEQGWLRSMPNPFCDERTPTAAPADHVAGDEMGGAS